MFFSDAFAQTAGGAAAGPDTMSLIMQNVLLIGPIVLIFYFLMWRPQQQRQKQFAEMVAGIRKNDTIVTTGGIIGKVKSVADDELRIEIAPNVDVRIERTAVAVVRNRTEPAPANDTKPTKSE